jgi:hypothetical protein
MDLNQPYDVARYRFLTAGLNWPALNLRLSAWGKAPHFVATDEVLSDITTRNVTTLLGTSLPITVKAVAPDGTAMTNGVVIPTVPVGPDVTHFTMSEANGALLLYIDDALDLPFTPNGMDIVIQPDWLSKRGWFRA